jgi:hypothetical protein
VPLFAWLALIFLLIVMVTGTFVTSNRALELKRSIRSLQRLIGGALEPVLARAATTEQRLATASATAARLDEAVDRLQRSTARATILASAAQEVGTSVRRTRASLPRK